jgi:hypothetical protein
MLPLAAALMLATHDEGVSQDAQAGENDAKATKPGEIKTLDRVRRLGTDDHFDLVVWNMGTAIVDRSPDPRETALKRIEEAKARLKANEDRSKVEPLLRPALAEYFIADMQHRVRELDQIKASIAESEAKLQKRLDSQQESVDLQLKLMLREVEGDGFFRKGDAASHSRLGSSTESGTSSLTFPSSLGGFGPASPHEKEQVAPELQPLTTILAKTQTLVLVVDDSLWEHYRLPASFDDESFKQLAAAILKALGSEADSKNLLRDNNSAELHIAFTGKRYEEFGKNIPGVIELLKKSADVREKAKADAVNRELLGNE